jgi:nucleoside-diphosphate-sugar epimerase
VTTVLVIGATGRVGRHVVSGLLDEGVALAARSRCPRGVEGVWGDVERLVEASGLPRMRFDGSRSQIRMLATSRTPPPVQEGGPPMMLGSNSPRMLSIGLPVVVY